MADRRFWLIIALVLGLLGAAFYKANPVTRGAAAYAGDIAVASAGVYVTLRTINAFLSTAQEVQVGGSLVVSGTAQPLKVLEPIDDTIERIAGVVFALMVVSGVLAVAMGAVGAVGWLMLGLACLIALLRPGPMRVFTWPLASYGIFLGLALPLAFVVSASVADRMTADVWAEHMATLDEITGQVAVDAPGEELGWMQSLDRYRELAANIYDRADELVRSYVALLSVFIFKIFVLPMMLAGGFYLIARTLARNGAAMA